MNKKLVVSWATLLPSARSAVSLVMTLPPAKPHFSYSRDGKIPSAVSLSSLSFIILLKPWVPAVAGCLSLL